MLWASEALGRDGKPAVLLLATTRTAASITAEAAYVASELPEGPLTGRYWRNGNAPPEPVTVHWPGGWPAVTPTNKLHPRKGTPESALDDEACIHLSILGGPVSNEQEEQEGE